MNVSVIGCGRWGTFIAWYLNNISHNVTLYGRQNSQNFTSLALYRRNEHLTLPSEINLTSDLQKVCKNDVLVISIPSQKLRSFCQSLQENGIKNKTIVLCMKGLEIDTGLRLSEVVKSVCDFSNKVAVWLGPGHAETYFSGVPGCMVIDSENESVKHLLVDQFSSNLIRFYYGSDMVGNEIGAAIKNVIGIAAGVLDGLHMSSLKGALMTRGAREVSRLIKAAGGNEMSAYGLCHLGDYEATLFSAYSHNRKFGEAIATNSEFCDLAEGYYSVQAIKNICEKHGVEMPICQGVYDILFNGADVKQTIEKLFNRSLTNELDVKNRNNEEAQDE